jgi:hypothetical protein
MFMNSTAVADAERKRLESIVAVRKRSPWVPNPPPVDHANPWPLSQRKACVTVEDLMSNSRRRVLSEMREVIAFSAFEYLPEMSGPEIARWLNMSRTTLVAARNRMRVKLETERSEASSPGPHPPTLCTGPSDAAA